jgi:hypothetical protein
VEFSPDSHSVGILGQSSDTFSYEELVWLRLAPADGIDIADRYGDLYLSNNYVLRPITVTNSAGDTTVSVTASTPYVGENLLLLINGKVSGNVSANYTEYLATTDLDGACQWEEVPLVQDDYYSIVLPGRGGYNPFTSTVYTAKFDLE